MSRETNNSIKASHTFSILFSEVDAVDSVYSVDSVDSVDSVVR